MIYGLNIQPDPVEASGRSDAPPGVPEMRRARQTFISGRWTSDQTGR